MGTSGTRQTPGREPERTALSIPSIVAIYWFVGTGWIVLSDLAFSGIRDRTLGETGWDIGKGLAFVTVTAALLWSLLLRRHRALEAAQRRADELQRGLEDAARMDALGRFAGGIAHDFNNLLAVIGGHVELARADAVPDQNESFDAIAEAVRRAGDLTGELQTVARRQRMDPRLVDLADVLRRNRSSLAAMLPDGVDVVVDCPSTPVTVELDEARFQQVVFNLASNASDAMPAGGTLSFDLRRRALDAVLTVSDNGAGMTDDELDRCFEPFFTTKPPGKGTGLGLSLAYGVVRQSGGHLTARSRPGAGSTFEITLPLAAGPDHIAPVQQPGTGSKR